ncbi:MAG TPA: PH domain-containing protein [Sphingomicrobium sp.]|nr:PH domain-containing protein [Sphingomicrobium sp.]
MIMQIDEWIEPRPGEEDPDGPGLLRVEPAYRNVLRLRFITLWIPIVIAAIVLDQAIDHTIFYGLPSTLVPLAALITIVIAPARIYRRLGYRLTDRLLQVVRGWLFHTDTMVPFVRVQHIDVTRGPIEKLFGTATLVVHTAGTHNSIVTLPGLAPDTAAQLRDVIREHVRTDFE